MRSQVLIMVAFMAVASAARAGNKKAYRKENESQKQPNFGTDVLGEGAPAVMANGAKAELDQDGNVIFTDFQNTASKGDDGVWKTGYDMSKVEDIASHVQSLYGTSAAFAALKRDGTAFVWGLHKEQLENGGGNCRDLYADCSDGFLLRDVKSISAAKEMGFAALKTDGSVLSWGTYDIFSSWSQVYKPQLLGNVSRIFSTQTAFAALKAEGSVVTWGLKRNGGDSSMVQEYLVDVTHISSTESAFAAVKADGSVVVWGNVGDGGDASTVQDQLVNVMQISSTWHDFAALKADGTVVTWGREVDRMSDIASSKLQNQLVNVQHLYSTGMAFAALKKDGSVVTWGQGRYGGDCSKVQDQLVDVVKIWATDTGFVAKTRIGDVVTWPSKAQGASSDSIEEFEALAKGSNEGFWYGTKRPWLNKSKPAGLIRPYNPLE